MSILLKFIIVATTAISFPVPILGNMLDPEDGLKVVNGNSVNPGDVPHQVSIQSAKPGSETHICGGSIVKVGEEMVVLSVAHCFLDSNPGDFKVLAGVINWTDTTNIRRQERNVSAIELHEEFDLEGWGENDISIFFIDRPFETSKTVNKILLPGQDQNVTSGSILTVSGWGDEFANKSFSEVLLAANLTIVENTRCQEMWDKNPNPNEKVLDIMDVMVCATGADMNQSGCHGDSGGPAFEIDMTGYEQLIGIMSGGTKTCGMDYPNIFTRVSKYIKWIHEKVASYYRQ